MWKPSQLVLGAALAFASMAMAGPGVQAQSDPCAAPDRRVACSHQCCGRRSCPPTCEVDCVKVCVDGCTSASRRSVYVSRLRELQIRCGNKFVQ